MHFNISKEIITDQIDEIKSLFVKTDKGKYFIKFAWWFKKIIGTSYVWLEFYSEDHITGERGYVNNKDIETDVTKSFIILFLYILVILFIVFITSILYIKS